MDESFLCRLGVLAGICRVAVPLVPDCRVMHSWPRLTVPRRGQVLAAVVGAVNQQGMDFMQPGCPVPPSLALKFKEISTIPCRLVLILMASMRGACFDHSWLVLYALQIWLFSCIGWVHACFCMLLHGLAWNHGVIVAGTDVCGLHAYIFGWGPACALCFCKGHLHFVGPLFGSLFRRVSCFFWVSPCCMVYSTFCNVLHFILVLTQLSAGAQLCVPFRFRCCSCPSAVGSCRQFRAPA